MKKYLHKIFIKDNSIDELDFILNDEFGIDTDNDQDYEIIEVGYGSAHAYAINIDTLIANLQELKGSGATHVEVDYHENHIGYDISAFIIRESTTDEINKHIKEEEVKRWTEQKRLDLIRQLCELDKKQVKNQYDNLPF
jgi:hypothetical protein